jgi:hypothetical protein
MGEQMFVKIKKRLAILPVGIFLISATAVATTADIGDGHDLKSSRFAGDKVLEAVYDNERYLRNGDSGAAVQKVQEALIEKSFDLPNLEPMVVSGLKPSQLSKSTRSHVNCKLMV